MHLWFGDPQGGGALKAIAEQAAPGVEWRDVDVTRELDYAVESGVMNLPATAVDGQLVSRRCRRPPS